MPAGLANAGLFFETGRGVRGGNESLSTGYFAFHLMAFGTPPSGGYQTNQEKNTDRDDRKPCG